jgi:hypothetical protein
MPKIVINKNHIDRFKQQRRSIGLLQFNLKEDQNISKWYALMENLVIKSFGQKSNQLIQVRDIHNHMHYSGDYNSESKLDTQEVKDKFKNLITVFISELELDFEDESKITTKKAGNMSVRMKNTQTINQTLNISTTIENIIENIKQVESDQQRVTESEQKLRELETEIKSKSPTWSKIKDILIWLLNFSRDAFLQVLPIILEKYKQ